MHTQVMRSTCFSWFPAAYLCAMTAVVIRAGNGRCTTDDQKARKRMSQEAHCEDQLKRRAVLGRFGIYAMATAPAMTVLLASRQSEAMGSRFDRSGNDSSKRHAGRSGSGGGFSL